MSRYRPISVTKASDLCATTVAMWQSQSNIYGTAYGVFLDAKRQPHIEYLKPGKEYLRAILPKGKTILDYPCTITPSEPIEPKTLKVARPRQPSLGSSKRTPKPPTGRPRGRPRKLSCEPSKPRLPKSPRVSLPKPTKTHAYEVILNGQTLRLIDSTGCLPVYSSADDPHLFVRLKSGEFIKADSADIAKVTGHRWTNYKTTLEYVGCKIGPRNNGKLILLHRFLMGQTVNDRKSRVVHRNGDRFDFRRENLELLQMSSRQKPLPEFDPQEGVEFPVIALDNGDGRQAILDRADYEIHGRVRWTYSPDGDYAKRWDGTKQRHVTLHGVITGKNRSKFLNGNRLDCRRINLSTK